MWLQCMSYGAFGGIRINMLLEELHFSKVRYIDLSLFLFSKFSGLVDDFPHLTVPRDRLLGTGKAHFAM